MATAPRPTTTTWDRWGSVFVVFSVVCLAAGGYLLDVAAPKEPNLFDKRWDAPVRTSWDLETARVGAALIAACAGSAAIGLLLRVLIGGSGAGHDAKAKALMAIGALGIIAVAWISWRGPFG